MALVVSGPTSLSISAGSSTNLPLQCLGTARLVYKLQTSTNLSTWVDHTNLVAGPNGLFDYLAMAVLGRSSCFSVSAGRRGSRP
jgi:hypothetical protein